jgi:hypothetical protein
MLNEFITHVDLNLSSIADIIYCGSRGQKEEMILLKKGGRIPFTAF